MTSTQTEPTVDVDIPRFNQALVAILTATAFVMAEPWLVGLTFVVLAISRRGGPAILARRSGRSAISDMRALADLAKVAG